MSYFQVFKLGKMCELKKCCCCVDLRTGAIVMAILEIIGGLGMFAGDEVAIGGAVVTVGAGLCLLFGAIKYHKLATLVYLVLQMIAIVLSGVAMIMVIVAATAVTATVSGSSHVHSNEVGAAGGVLLGVMASFYGIFASLNIYFWVCVFSFYKGLKTGKIASPV